MNTATIWFADGMPKTFEDVSDFKLEKGLITFRYLESNIPQIAVFNQSKILGYSYIDTTKQEGDSH